MVRHDHLAVGGDGFIHRYRGHFTAAHGQAHPFAADRFKRGRSVADGNDVIRPVWLDGESIVIGALADSVEEVIDLEPDQIEPAPKIGTKIRTDFIKGMGKRDTQFIMILDIDRVFSAEELAAVRGQESSKQLMEVAA